MFGKCVTKLTGKVAQAVTDGSMKLKRMASSFSHKEQPKKSKKAPSTFNEFIVTSSLSPPPDTPNGQPNLHHQASVHTEEEEQSLYEDTVVIDSDIESVNSKHSDAESQMESSDIELAEKEWSSPVYAFFEPVPSIEYTGGCRSHVFKCMAKGCKQCVHCYLNKGDAKSMSNMAKHAKNCWGEAAYQAAQGSGTAESAHEMVVQSILQTGLITSAFKRKGKGKITYSHRQHSKTEAHVEIIRWVAESL
ncbi:hypothetical protein EDB19DRAFT_1908355 [Suillus lakei]|nr:hypothetical protein EDB19DRAFT_1908355 [Suillus lakei]